MTDQYSIKIALQRHRMAVEAFLGFAAIYPCDDDVQPLIELLGDDMRRSFDALYPRIHALMEDDLKMKKCGLNAWRAGLELPVQVLESAAGFYLGTQTDEGPFSRESEEYFETEALAATALQDDSWTQHEL